MYNLSGLLLWYANDCVVSTTGCAGKQAYDRRGLRAALKACRQVPKSLEHAVVVQVLVSILDDQAIPIRGFT